MALSSFRDFSKPVDLTALREVAQTPRCGWALGAGLKHCPAASPALYESQGRLANRGSIPRIAQSSLDV